jgi:hypothetical protein
MTTYRGLVVVPPGHVNTCGPFRGLFDNRRPLYGFDLTPSPEDAELIVKSIRDKRKELGKPLHKRK